LAPSTEPIAPRSAQSVSEIVGFAELLIEEARERQLRTLMPGLDVIRQSANRILADLNHALNPDTLRLSPEVLKALHETVRRLSEDILGTSQNLSDQCDELGQAALGEDLLRISGSARRLREMAPAALDGLIGQGSGRAVPIDMSAGSSEESALDANKRMSDQLRKYTGWLFGKTLFSQAVAAPGSLNLTTQERTILFADIRGFTRWSECHAPVDAVTMLNRYFETAERIWTNSSVIKTEYTGDEIMGVFTSANDAVRIAQALRLELGRLLDEVGLAIGVGLHIGPVIEGLMGGAEVKAYRFVGDTVNTAKRICSEAQPGQVLLSEPAFVQVSPAVVAGPAFELSAKGKSELLKVRPLLELV